MFTSLNPVSVPSEKPAGRDDVLTAPEPVVPEPVRVPRASAQLTQTIDGIGPGSARVVVVDLTLSLLPGSMVKARVGSRRYLLPPPSPG